MHKRCAANIPNSCGINEKQLASILQDIGKLNPDASTHTNTKVCYNAAAAAAAAATCARAYAYKPPCVACSCGRQTSCFVSTAVSAFGKSKILKSSFCLSQRKVMRSRRSLQVDFLVFCNHSSSFKCLSTSNVKLF